MPSGGPNRTLINSAGTETGTATTPFRTDPVGTTPQAASQSGTWTVQPGDTANTTPWLVKNHPLDGNRATYSASIVGLVSAASATDIFVLQGSATKTIKITRLEVSGSTSSGSGISVNAQVIRRSAANTGGTASTLTNVPHDSSDAAATAVATAYTANPSALGAAVGVVRSTRMVFATTGAANDPMEWTFGDRPSRALTLRGIAQFLTVNLAATTITGPLIDINIEWTEE